jgi:hypothetical protein
MSALDVLPPGEAYLLCRRFGARWATLNRLRIADWLIPKLGLDSRITGS